MNSTSNPTPATKICLITGANGSIGRVVADELLQTGEYELILNYHVNRESVDELKKKYGDRVSLVQCDVTREEEVRRMVEGAIKRHGKIDVLINNAGIIRDATFRNMTGDKWREVMDVNLNGVYIVSYHVYEYMLRQNSGNIINISSIVGEMGNIGQTNYSASKAALIGFTQSLAKEAARFNVRVNAIAPGFVESRMISDIPEKVRNRLTEKIPLKRFGAPREIAMTVEYICNCEYLTGAVIDVNGGLHL